MQISPSYTLPYNDQLSFYENGRFLHHKFAYFLLNNDKIKRINGLLHVYDGKVYVDGYKYIERKMIQYIPNLKDAQRKEVLKYLEILCCDTIDTEPFSRYIAFNNGIYDIHTKTMLEHSDELIVTNLIPHDYQPQAYDETVDKVLNRLSCNDSSIRNILEEAIGYCFNRRPELSKAFIFIGSNSNGKSTYLTMLERTLGINNYTAVELQELNERFLKVLLQGKLACIGDDISSKALTENTIAMFKKIVSGNTIVGEFKGKDAFIFNPFATLFFSCNSVPHINDPEGAVARRIVFVPMNAKFTKHDKDFDPYIISKLTTENAIEYVIRLGIDGLHRVLEGNDFTSSKTADKLLEDFKRDSNPINRFIEEFGEENFEKAQTFSAYESYLDYCRSYKVVPLRPDKFSRTICATLNLSTQARKLDGKSVRFFVRKV